MFLLDTCTLLWLAGDMKRISAAAIHMIEESTGLYISSISAFEIAIKHRKKKLTLPEPPARWFSAVLEHHGIIELPVDAGVFIASARLPGIHNDPADRIIIATAMVKGLTILTPDPVIHKYKEAVARW